MTNDKEKQFCLYTSVVFSALLICASCSEQRLANSIPMSDDIVMPGQGIKSCYVGMPVNQLQGEWIPGDPNSFITCDYLNNPAMGIIVIQIDAKVGSVNVVYQPDEYEKLDVAYRGKTDKGISAESSIENVIHTYGQPTSISATIDVDTREQSVSLDYLELGIHFSFMEGELITVTASSPQHDYDPWMAEDIGNTTQYRAIRKLAE